MTMEIEKQPVSSSNIEALGYDESTQTLRVWFTIGNIYDYANVPQIEFEQLKFAPSIGAYFNRNIKGAYPYIKVG
jgi:hypothetical protein